MLIKINPMVFKYPLSGTGFFIFFSIIHAPINKTPRRKERSLSGVVR